MNVKKQDLPKNKTKNKEATVCPMSKCDDQRISVLISPFALTSENIQHGPAVDEPILIF
jgi:hypothetical protein